MDHNIIKLIFILLVPIIIFIIILNECGFFRCCKCKCKCKKSNRVNIQPIVQSTRYNGECNNELIVVIARPICSVDITEEDVIILDPS